MADTVGVPLPDSLLQSQPQGLADLVIGAAQRDHGQHELEQQHEDGVPGPPRFGQVLLASLQITQPGHDDLLEETSCGDVRVIHVRGGDGRWHEVRRVAVTRLGVIDEEVSGPTGPILQGLPDGQRTGKKEKGRDL